ncbi:hypothetical protein YDYSY3_39410 [Paenibacillus chitinolyticus]|uniref:hypothetical protein n=1 Tax=Paenibacillus chitinolyticus TaxID=79263 RepID=UPI0026E4B955|nr:hypothetical protein [Paenibacillus chitinolyticus]GKS12941.1 hypothetical protein YDYSY3_39410 [Paenibacillus chitinolyticus]
MNYNIKDLILVLPSLIVICGWIVSYFLNSKQKNNEMFLTRVHAEIKDVIFPIKVSVENILSEEHVPSKNRALQKFKKHYSGASSPLYMGSNSEIYYNYRLFEEAYEHYESTPEKTTWIELEKSLNKLHSVAIKNLKKYREVYNRNHEWNIKMKAWNPIVAFIFEIFRLTLVTLNALAVIALVALFLVIYEVATHHLIYDKLILFPFFEYIFISSCYIFVLWLTFHLLNYIAVGYNTNNRFEYGKRSWLKKLLNLIKKGKWFTSKNN